MKIQLQELEEELTLQGTLTSFRRTRKQSADAADIFTPKSAIKNIKFDTSELSSERSPLPKLVQNKIKKQHHFAKGLPKYGNQMGKQMVDMTHDCPLELYWKPIKREAEKKPTQQMLKDKLLLKDWEM